ncbi:hypothetical protein [Streptomyces xiaopingdaonensis]|uniref:hypothetical protein n=1 Tax=Streptomyces xiaopingdaonensis TaxID=1565415 RepID=UPI0012FEB8F8|nr:hypothetical protein [Streptomyces xiaopingdaonensis]
MAAAQLNIDTLHQTLRKNRNEFGLLSVTVEAGERLTRAVTVGQPIPAEPKEVAQFIAAVGGTGGTLADAAVRRAAHSSANRLLARYVSETGSSRGVFSGELFCYLYRLFFGDVVAEFLRMAVAEQISLALPIPLMFGAEEEFTESVSGKIVDLLPDPCAEARHAEEAAQKTQDAVEFFGDPEGQLADSLTERAEKLVPQTALRALGLADPNEPKIDTAL